ncbi:MAG: hypothetical protein OXD46_01140 [Chloroflexi bacterium]|nr:hypothetical protein [Chloroflexota bacterium]
MNTSFTASVRQNAGRRAFIVDFRHPLRPDPSNQGKPGRKVRRGLGTDDRAIADELVAQLNRLLADPTLHSPTARAKAATRFDPQVVEIFYDGVGSKRLDYRALRDEHLPFPPRNEGYPRILLLGAPGAGKTTLVRQLIGSHPDRDRFPSTSVNRTTTCETEVVTGREDYSAAITFMSEEEADFEVRQSLSGAVLRAVVDATDADIAKVFLERSDMRFRLKYLLGDWPRGEVDIDPYENPDDDAGQVQENQGDASVHGVTPAEAESLSGKLRAYVGAIREIAAVARNEVEKTLLAQLDTLSPDERNTALDWIQELAEQSDGYAALAGELLDELREKFRGIPFGRVRSTTTGWPRLWLMTSSPDSRAEFLIAVRFFSGIDRQMWGKLLTPLVNGIRVAGPFSPSWTSNAKMPQFVLIDTEGLGHKANVTSDVPDHIVSLFAESDAILLLHKGDAPFSFEGGKALEAIGGAGQTIKTMLVFSRMDAVKGDNIRGWQAKRDYTFDGVRNVVENQIAKSMTPEVARFMLSHLEGNSFYLGSLQNADPKAAVPELTALFDRLTSIVAPPAPTRAFPKYTDDLLVLALHRGVEKFRMQWRGQLGLERHSEFPPLPWQSVKAVSRRYAEGFNDGYHIRPVSNLLNDMTLAIARFLESPVRWEGNPSAEDERAILERVKERVSGELVRFCNRQLREEPQPQWHEAYAFRGHGSTFDRKVKIEALYERQVPIPGGGSDDMLHVQRFIDAVKPLVKGAIDSVRDSLPEQVLADDPRLSDDEPS